MAGMRRLVAECGKVILKLEKIDGVNSQKNYWPKKYDLGLSKNILLYA
jgi:hypothetical protein